MIFGKIGPFLRQKWENNGVKWENNEVLKNGTISTPKMGK